MRTFHAAIAPKDVPEPASSARSWMAATESLLERLVEKLNPILVKEARQAMKSLQFVITFSLLIICGWAWTALALAIAYSNYGNSVYYHPIGPWVLAGYFAVLAAPMVIIVPFAAFRSLASEREDGTYELLSITALSARQIITGKLGSSILQMIVYYSALSPCIAFTYLLRGIDVVSIMLVLVVLFMGSVLLSAFALFVATFSKSQVWQVLMSILLLIGLLILYLWSISALFMWVDEGVPTAYDINEFWIAQVCWVSFYISFLVLFILAAAAQISFSSDNRSTKLRIVMFCQNLLMLGWFTYLWIIAEGAHEVWFIMFSVSGLYWAIMGALMIGETAELSPRVRRQLPQSLFARTMLTWFSPGSGTGYMFTICTFALNIFVVLSLFAYPQTQQLRQQLNEPFNPWGVIYGIVVLGYLTAYLGLSRILVRLLRINIEMGLFRSFAITLFLVSMGIVLPTIGATVIQQTSWSYNWLQSTNWGWTLVETAEEDLFATPGAPALIFLAAGIMFLVNLVTTSKEIEQTRVAAPQRVQDDDEAMRPAAAPAGPSSPWDIPDPPDEPETPSD